jgi:branched-chain amino acid transport system ATP-binding protein
MPKGRGVLPSLTARENIAIQSVAGQEKISLQRSVDAFAQLKDRLGQTAGTLSGGQQPMLAMARRTDAKPEADPGERGVDRSRAACR